MVHILNDQFGLKYNHVCQYQHARVEVCICSYTHRVYPTHLFENTWRRSSVSYANEFKRLLYMYILPSRILPSLGHIIFITNESSVFKHQSSENLHLRAGVHLRGAGKPYPHYWIFYTALYVDSTTSKQMLFQNFCISFSLVCDFF